MQSIIVNKPSDLEQVESPSVLMFYRKSCPYCQKSMPGFEQLAKKYGAKTALVDVTSSGNKDLVNMFAQEAVPTFVFFDGNGEPSDTLVGLRSKEEIEEKLQSVM